MTPAFVVAAPSSGSGKTLVTLGLLRAFRDAGVAAGSAKIGPDYIDPRFHAAASGRASLNLDGWAMSRERLLALASDAGRDAEVLVVEGVMGLFDKAGEPGLGAGGTADVAKALGASVVLVVDASGMAQSVGALASGFRIFDLDVEFAGVILNRVASLRHEALLREGCAAAGVPVFGAIPRRTELGTPSRHLGLVQAEELEGLEQFIAAAAREVAAHVDLPVLKAIARFPSSDSDAPASPPVRPLGARIAVADDVAFRFAYPHVLAGWRAAGAEILPFSPLADEPPDSFADAVFLPGGYPELHAGRVSAAARFASGVRAAAARGAIVYGECGGYMVLGEGLIDADGARHQMLGLLPLETSFKRRKLHLGYRRAALAANGPLGPAGLDCRAHEFHYASTLWEGEAAPLFRLGEGTTAGLSVGTVAGSFLHLIDAS
ncbi:cobyrinate a,c-diamide synthase [Chelatococcus sambhunathii]|uniref:Hydrogenobyrinate a,c-diamide synthase n=1 Tax=Chelatococcus sambhunathii TaxID=363953 RepID=A0ABU1DEE1_9HYPH|nr:cobyrinate a,c-diamide synthase [Chelatococcus sambhunathii]MDR4306403.1 cobyrinate a,c-diamide synthase [Chelatococcus sambhunathii]